MTPSPSRAPQRADARRSIERILAASADCLGRDPQASTSEIAQAAGVGRVTLYGHFASREALVEATFLHVLELGEQMLEEVTLTGRPRADLRALIESSWQLVAMSVGVLEAAQLVLPADRIRTMHAAPERRIDELIRRGQADGDFRTDLPASWLAGSLHYLMHGAGTAVVAGRLDEADAGRYIVETVLAAYRPQD